MRGGLVTPDCDPPFPVRILKAALAYTAETSPGIPDMISPRIIGNNTTVRTFEDVGHADLLDDTWAELGRTVMPWMTGVVSPQVAFSDWSATARTKASDIRRMYRRDVADDVIEHMLHRHPPTTEETEGCLDIQATPSA